MLNKFLLILAFFTMPIMAVAENSSNVIEKVLSSLEALNPYKVNIEVVYEGVSMPGYYEVDQSKYYISIDQQELYGDASTKFEVYKSRKEVIIDTVKPDFDGNLLNNPATAFSAIKDHYKSTIISDTEDIIIVDLKPIIDNGNMQESIELYISKSDMLPQSVVYRYGDEEVEIKILDIAHLTSTITLFNKSNYSDFEVIDFR